LTAISSLLTQEGLPRRTRRNWSAVPFPVPKPGGKSKSRQYPLRNERVLQALQQLFRKKIEMERSSGFPRTGGPGASRHAFRASLELPPRGRSAAPAPERRSSRRLCAPRSEKASAGARPRRDFSRKPPPTFFWKFPVGLKMPADRRPHFPFRAGRSYSRFVRRCSQTPPAAMVHSRSQ